MDGSEAGMPGSVDGAIYRDFPASVRTALVAVVLTAAVAGPDDAPELTAAIGRLCAELRRRLLPDAMTPAIEDVLGQMNFMVGPIAHAFQAAGEAIPKKYEAEQAHVLFRFLHLALQHGDGWRQEAGKQLRAAIDAVKARELGQGAP